MVSDIKSLQHENHELSTITKAINDKNTQL